MITLYDYYRSTASYRVRIVMALKSIPHALCGVHLVKEGGQQHSPTFRQKNPQGRVPCLDDNGFVISQSLAIIDYLEKKYPNPPLYTMDDCYDAHINAIAQIVTCDVHPLNNLSVLQYLEKEVGCSKSQKMQWYHHWVHEGFSAIEAMLEPGGNYCIANQLTLADVCLVPQVYNANRFDVDMAPYPKIRRINRHCLSLPVFDAAKPVAV